MFHGNNHFGTLWRVNLIVGKILVRLEIARRNFLNGRRNSKNSNRPLPLHFSLHRCRSREACFLFSSESHRKYPISSVHCLERHYRGDDKQFAANRTVEQRVITSPGTVYSIELICPRATIFTTSKALTSTRAT